MFNNTFSVSLSVFYINIEANNFASSIDGIDRVVVLRILELIINNFVKNDAKLFIIVSRNINAINRGSTRPSRPDLTIPDDLIFDSNGQRSDRSVD